MKIAVEAIKHPVCSSAATPLQKTPKKQKTPGTKSLNVNKKGNIH